MVDGFCWHFLIIKRQLHHSVLMGVASVSSLPASTSECVKHGIVLYCEPAFRIMECLTSFD